MLFLPKSNAKHHTNKQECKKIWNAVLTCVTGLSSQKVLLLLTVQLQPLHTEAVLISLW